MANAIRPKTRMAVLLALLITSVLASRCTAHEKTSQSAAAAPSVSGGSPTAETVAAEAPQFGRSTSL